MEVKEIINLGTKLGNNYVLVPKPNDGWALIRNNKLGYVVLDSEKNSKEELIEFVKKHRVYEPIDTMSKVLSIINLLIFLLCLINVIFIHSNFIGCIAMGMLLVCALVLLGIEIIDNHNKKVDETVGKDDLEEINKIQKRLEKLSKMADKIDTAVKKTKSSAKKTTKPRKTTKVKEERKED